MNGPQPWRGDLPAPDGRAVGVPEFLFEHAARIGDKPALVDGPTGRALSYRQLADAVERVAAGLAARGFAKGDVLALSSPNLPEYAVAMYGAMAAGGVVTGANPLLTAGELAGQLADAGASILVTVMPFLEVAMEAAASAGVGEVLVLGEVEGATPFASLLATGAAPVEVPIDPDRDLATLPYSSGTTGLPKGVELTHANLVAQARQAQAVMGLTEDDVVVGMAPFFHAIGQNIILPCSLRAGATVVTMPASTWPASSGWCRSTGRPSPSWSRRSCSPWPASRWSMATTCRPCACSAAGRRRSGPTSSSAAPTGWAARSSRDSA